MKKSAEFISIMFHPLLLTSWLFLIIYLFSPAIFQASKNNAFAQLLGVIFFITFLLPLISILLMKYSGNIENLYLRERKERIIPFFIVFVFYSIATYLFIEKVQVLIVVSSILMTTTVISFILAVITIFWKISAHSMASAGMVGILLGITWKQGNTELLLPVIISTVLSGIIMTSRLILDEHEPSEIYLGALTGLLVSFIFIATF